MSCSISAEGSPYSGTANPIPLDSSPEKEEVLGAEVGALLETASQASSFAGIADALAKRVDLLNQKENPDRPCISASAVRKTQQAYYELQKRRMENHATLAPMCQDLVAKAFSRNPLPDRVVETPRIYVTAVKKALQLEARSVCMDISDLDLCSTESINIALDRIQRGRNASLSTFFTLLSVDTIIDDAPLLGILNAPTDLNEKATEIRRWITSNQALLDAVIAITLNNRELTSIPSEICYFTQLELLDLNNNQISVIPDSLGQCTQLEQLYLSNNQISVIPDALGQCTLLEWLDLSNNQISVIPDSLGQCTQLEQLYLSNNQISVIPDALEQCTELVRLELNNNQIRVIPDALGQCTLLRWLDLNQNQISTIPDALGQCTLLESLNLNQNQISTIPDALEQCTWLANLNLNQNQISTIPDALGQCTRLKCLELNHNQISVIPDALGQCTQLWNLDLGNNQISVIPDSLGQCTELMWLELNNN